MQALQFVLTTVPRRFHEYLPMAILLGTLIGLGLMANSGELSVIRAAGVSTLQVSWMVLRPVIFLMLLSIPVGEYLAPYTEQVAQSNRSLQEGGGEALRSEYGFWHREGDEFIHINTVQPNGVLYGLTRYRFQRRSPAGREPVRGKGALPGRSLDAAEHSGHPFRRRPHRNLHRRRRPLGHQPDPAIAEYRGPEPRRLAMAKLWNYTRYMKEQGLQSADYMLAFWQKLLMPAATIGMVLIAISFIFGPLREVTMGLRMAAGIVAGLTFNYGQQFLDICPWCSAPSRCWPPGYPRCCAWYWASGCCCGCAERLAMLAGLGILAARDSGFAVQR